MWIGCVRAFRLRPLVVSLPPAVLETYAGRLVGLARLWGDAQKRGSGAELSECYANAREWSSDKGGNAKAEEKRLL